MNFQRGRGREEPEINLIAMIDVLLVILIFLMVTTSYSKVAGLEINLPVAGSTLSKDAKSEINIVVGPTGDVLVDQGVVGGNGVEAIRIALVRAAGSSKDPMIVISADARATHQRVIDVMQAAQLAGYPRIAFATQTPNR